MNSSSEQENFSKRFRQALRNADYSPDSPTQLAREFNIRYSSGHVTPHAVRKWLVGESIPTQEKLRILANWLGVTAEWLRYGGEQTHNSKVPVLAGDAAELPERFESADVKLLTDLYRLDKNYQMIAREIIRMLVRISHTKE
jgi:transcriptional regulator with XRE-family HTH domain